MLDWADVRLKKREASNLIREIEMLTESLAIKYERLRTTLRSMENILIAFSGGVDSTLLLKVAADVLAKDRILAVTARSHTTPGSELDEAARLAAQLSTPHLVFDTSEMESIDFTSNTADRCYVCKRIRFLELLGLAKERGVPHMVEGSNLDDQSDYRPGLRAIRELGVRSPLSEAELTKGEIRLLSRELGLPTWDKPSAACLASRIPYGAEITAEKLQQIDLCENFLRREKLAQQVRVRHYGDTARIEVDAACLAQLTEPSTRRKLLRFFKQTGFQFVTLDLEGYQMGSMNRALDWERTGPGQQTP